MARITIVMPHKNGNRVVSYDDGYQALKKKLDGKTFEVTFEDKELYTDDTIALSDDKAEARVSEVVFRRAQQVDEIKDQLRGLGTGDLTVQGMDKAKVGLTHKAQVHFPNTDLKKIEFDLKLSGPERSDPEKRRTRAVKKPKLTYTIDYRGLNPEPRLKKKIEDIALAGPDGVRGGLESVQGERVYHKTIPRANLSVFYNWDENELKVYGIGRHPDGEDNSTYEVEWHDGRTLTLSR